VAIALPARRAPALRAGLSIARDVARTPGGIFGLVVVTGLLAVVAFAPLLAPSDPAQQDIVNRLQPPSTDHVLGTDQLGRDLLSRLLFATRVALGVAFPAVLAALGIGLVIGLLAGYVGGWIDNLMIVLMDTMQSIPSVPLALFLLALLGPSLTNVIIAIAVAFAPSYARIARALVLATKENQFVEAERSLGASGLRIVGVHIVPNMIAPLFVLLAMDLPSAIITEAGLSFLGIGVQPPDVSWGTILSDGFQRVRDTPWPVLSAGVAIMVTTLGFTLLAERLRDIVDPRLAGVRRWRRA
jgi:peptide/nickel transport system permease protein